MSITVPPPFYETWWFLVLALTAALGAACLIWQARVSVFKRKEAMHQAFTRQLIASQEGERKRIAAELHDGLGQQLVVIRNLALISLQGAPDHACESRIEDISATAAQALSESGRFPAINGLSIGPSGIDESRASGCQTGLDGHSLHFEIDAIDNVFAKDSEINFYRIVPGCVNNLVKHSQAAAAGVIVRRAAQELQLTVGDNREGFAPRAAHPRVHRAALA